MAKTASSTNSKSAKTASALNRGETIHGKGAGKAEDCNTTLSASMAFPGVVIA